MPLPPIRGSPQGSAGEMPTPQVRGFRIPASRMSGAGSGSIISCLSSVPFIKLCEDFEDPQTVLALNVESRDIQKSPYLFSIVYFRPDAIDVLYTLTPTTSPKVRKLAVLKYALNLLTLCSSQYEANLKYLYQMLESTLSELNEYVSSDYQKLFSSYDNLKTNVADIEKKAKSLSESNAALAKDNYELKAKNEELTIKIRQMQGFSDQVLAVKLQEWLAEHNGEINLSDFARVNNVSEERVEQVLNQLVSEGFLENRQ